MKTCQTWSNSTIFFKTRCSSGGLWESTPDNSAPGAARFLPTAVQGAEPRTRSTGTARGPAADLDQGMIDYRKGQEVI